ncbi:MAG: di-trans,poly-cis-decaprenylcistransferase [Clostridia bacterium]|nr:di-trans,poly-cis-decaprenylcistransferase [Clostridia bacterium]
MGIFGKSQNKTGGETVVVDDRLKHIGFIMDGNGRWAKKRMMPREYGHREGAKVFEDISEYCGSIGIKAVTVYAFSTENWKRPDNEVGAIMKLFSAYLFKALDSMMKKDIHIVFLGDKSVFSESDRALMDRIERESVNNSKRLNIAVNYGGRDDIVHAVNKAIESGETHITEEIISRNLYTHDCPDPDLIVRTGNEMRLSNFLLWQSAYSELYFTETLWPDMRHADVDEAIRVFYSRKRRYGNV